MALLCNVMAADNEFDLRTRYVVIDSRDRDHVAYPTPNKYEIRLDDDISDVVSMKLVAADVPFSALLVGDWNAYLPVSLDGGETVVDAVLEAGDYSSPAEMASAITTALTCAMPTATFATSYASRTDAFTFTGSVPFTFAFRTSGRKNTAARMLGFSPKEDYASADGEIRAPFRRDFSPCKYIVLNISPSAEVVTSINNATNRSFAILPRRYTDMSIETDAAVFEKKWFPPLGRFARVGVEFTDYEGNPYDFQNQEHVLHLLFTNMRQHRNYRI
jgi:hypothetical protein